MLRTIEEYRALAALGALHRAVPDSRVAAGSEAFASRTGLGPAGLNRKKKGHASERVRQSFGLTFH
jgi:hypothetical protein